MKRIILGLMRARGYSTYFSGTAARLWLQDLFGRRTVSWRRQLWGYRHGFFLNVGHWQDVTPENYQDYIPDIPYMKAHPINGRYNAWIDDKLTFRFLLDPFRRYLPKYYFHALQGKTFRLMDCPSELPAGFDGVMDLLAEKKALAFKLNSGTGGAGFYKVALQDGEILVNGQTHTKEQFQAFYLSLGNYLVTEFVTPHRDIRRYYDKSSGTVRVTLVNPEGNKPVVIFAMLKIGNSLSGFVDNVRAGGFGFHVDPDSGEILKTVHRMDAAKAEAFVHPDSGERITGSIPHWPEILRIIGDICRYVPTIRYAGFDLIVTDTSFKIIEINSHPDVYDNPLLRHPAARKFFTDLFNEKNPSR